MTEGDEASTVVRAPATHVWELITNVTRTGERSPENTGSVWLDGATGPTVGARFRGTNRRGRTKWRSTCEVTTGVRDRRADLEENVRQGLARIKEILEG